VLSNNFTNIYISNFQQLQTINITGPASGNIGSLNIQNTPLLTQLTVNSTTITDALIQNTSLSSFPDANSNLSGLLRLSLQDNPLLTILYTSKMPNVQNYEIINTPIENTDSSSLLELRF
jgi:hypothetical protein